MSKEQIFIDRLNKSGNTELIVAYQNFAKEIHERYDKIIANLEQIKKCGLGDISESFLTEKKQREYQKEIYAENPLSDYGIIYIDEAYHKGIEVGIWGIFNSKLKSLETKLLNDTKKPKI